MHLAVDIGNTFIKVGGFQEKNLKEKFTFENLDKLIEFMKTRKFHKVIICSVNQNYRDIIKLLPSNNEYLTLDIETPLPFLNSYKSATLGLDRIALVAGAIELYPNKNCLIIDAGTCITYDFINENGKYLGGAISPGIDIRLKSLNTFTARLPLIQAAGIPSLIGQDTESSIQSGVMHGILGEISGFISYYEKEYNNLQLILTGGSAKYFESKIKAPIFAIPELLLVGLNAILRHNASF